MKNDSTTLKKTYHSSLAIPPGEYLEEVEQTERLKSEMGDDHCRLKGGSNSPGQEMGYNGYRKVW